MARKANKSKAIGEFALIDRFFAPLAKADRLAFGLTDDVAFLRSRKGRDLVVTKDVVVAGVHFRDNDSPDLVARKA